MTEAAQEWPAVMSKGEYGAYRKERFGRGSGPYISKLIGKGRLTAPALRPDGKVDREAADAQIAAVSDPARAGELQLGKLAARHAGSPYQQVRTAREYYQAMELRLRYMKQAGDLCFTADIAAATEAIVRRMGSDLLELPRRVSSGLAQTSDPFEVEKILSDEIRQVCERMSEALHAMAARAQAEHATSDPGVDALAHLFDERRSPAPGAES